MDIIKMGNTRLDTKRLAPFEPTKSTPIYNIYYF